MNGAMRGKTNSLSPASIDALERRMAADAGGFSPSVEE
jgi:hypothetical protein